MRIHNSFARKISTLLFSLLLILCLSVGLNTASANGAAQALVSTQWLADNLKTPGLAIIYVGGPASKKENFEMKHVPGAVFLDFMTLMGTLGDGSTPPDQAKFEALAGSLGVGNDSHVVIHSADTLFGATAYWLFEYFGHKNLSMMNGSVAKWMNEGLPSASGPTDITPATYKASVNAAVFANADEVLKNLNNPKAVIVDVRSTDEYTGAGSPPGIENKSMGHVPGAVHLDFYSTNLNNDGSFKSADELKAAYEGKGVTKDKEVIVYCQGGVRAAVSDFALEHILGYPSVKNYVGSWGEWGNRLDTAKYPIEK